MAATYDAITEFRLNQYAKDIAIFIYDLPVNNLDTKHKENGKLVGKLRNNNNNAIIVFNENLVGAFSKIDNWCGAKVNTSDDKAQRTIDISNERERKLLERLIKQDIVCHADKTLYKNICGNYLKSIRPVWSNKDTDIYEKTGVSVNIDDSGYIIVNVDITHEFDGKIPLDKEIANGNVEKGEEVKDPFCGNTYEYIGIAPFTISETNKYIGQSIVEYYAQKGQSYITAALSPDTQAVLTKTKEGEIYPYIPSRLRKVIRLESLHGAADSIIKMNADKKMRKIIDAAVSLTWTSSIAKMDGNKDMHTKIIKNDMLCKNLGYYAYDLQMPILRFGGEHTCGYSYGGLIRSINDFGPYRKREEAVEIRYFVDSLILRDKGKYNAIKGVITELEQRAGKSKVTLKRVPITDKAYEKVNMNDDTSFEIFLRGEIDKKTFDSPTVFFMGDKHLEKHYATIKKVLGGHGGVATQCVKFDKLMNTDEKGRNSYMTNILLGIYAKSNIQSWALNKPLNSDCFVGLDVSRENGVNKSAFVQVIGKDGGVISSKIFAASQKGEAITDETLREMLLDAITAYTRRYGEKPHHITFHRDGRCFENMDALTRVAKETGVKFDYVEITKSTHHRMATYSGTKESGQWQTVMGRCYKKDSYAYLCATAPSEKVGMAQPIRITAKTSTLGLDKIIEDGNVNKSAVP